MTQGRASEAVEGAVETDQGEGVRIGPFRTLSPTQLIFVEEVSCHTTDADRARTASHTSFGASHAHTDQKV